MKRLFDFLGIEYTEFKDGEESEKAISKAIEMQKTQEALRGLHQLLAISLPGTDFVVEIGGKKTRYLIESVEDYGQHKVTF